MARRREEAELEVRDLLNPDARRGLAAKLRLPEEWNGMGSAAFLLGEPSGMLRNRNLEVFSTLIRFGNDENPSITTR